MRSFKKAAAVLMLVSFVFSTVSPVLAADETITVSTNSASGVTVNATETTKTVDGSLTINNTAGVSNVKGIASCGEGDHAVTAANTLAIDLGVANEASGGVIGIYGCGSSNNTTIRAGTIDIKTKSPNGDAFVVMVNSGNTFKLSSGIGGMSVNASNSAGTYSYGIYSKAKQTEIESAGNITVTGTSGNDNAYGAYYCNTGSLLISAGGLLNVLGFNTNAAGNKAGGGIYSNGTVTNITAKDDITITGKSVNSTAYGVQLCNTTRTTDTKAGSSAIIRSENGGITILADAGGKGNAFGIQTNNESLGVLAKKDINISSKTLEEKGASTCASGIRAYNGSSVKSIKLSSTEGNIIIFGKSTNASAEGIYISNCNNAETLSVTAGKNINISASAKSAANAIQTGAKDNTISAKDSIILDAVSTTTTANAINAQNVKSMTVVAENGISLNASAQGSAYGVYATGGAVNISSAKGGLDAKAAGGHDSATSTVAAIANNGKGSVEITTAEDVSLSAVSELSTANGIWLNASAASGTYGSITAGGSVNISAAGAAEANGIQSSYEKLEITAEETLKISANGNVAFGIHYNRQGTGNAVVSAKKIAITAEGGNSYGVSAAGDGAQLTLMNTGTERGSINASVGVNAENGATITLGYMSVAGSVAAFSTNSSGSVILSNSEATGNASVAQNATLSVGLSANSTWTGAAGAQENSTLNVIVEDGSKWIMNGDVNLGNGTLTNKGTLKAGTAMNLTGTVNVTGGTVTGSALTIAGGKITVDKTGSIENDVTVGTGATLEAYATGLKNCVTNNGTVNLTGGTVKDENLVSYTNVGDAKLNLTGTAIYDTKSNKVFTSALTTFTGDITKTEDKNAYVDENNYTSNSLVANKLTYVSGQVELNDDYYTLDYARLAKKTLENTGSATNIVMKGNLVTKVEEGGKQTVLVDALDNNTGAAEIIQDKAMTILTLNGDLLVGSNEVTKNGETLEALQTGTNLTIRDTTSKSINADKIELANTASGVIVTNERDVTVGGKSATAETAGEAVIVTGKETVAIDVDVKVGLDQATFDDVNATLAEGQKLAKKNGTFSIGSEADKKYELAGKLTVNEGSTATMAGQTTITKTLTLSGAENEASTLNIVSGGETTVKDTVTAKGAMINLAEGSTLNFAKDFTITDGKNEITGSGKVKGEKIVNGATLKTNAVALEIKEIENNSKNTLEFNDAADAEINYNITMADNGEGHTKINTATADVKITNKGNITQKFVTVEQGWLVSKEGNIAADSLVINANGTVEANANTLKAEIANGGTVDFIGGTLAKSYASTGTTNIKNSMKFKDAVNVKDSTLNFYLDGFSAGATIVTSDKAVELNGATKVGLYQVKDYDSKLTKDGDKITLIDNAEGYEEYTEANPNRVKVQGGLVEDIYGVYQSEAGALEAEFVKRGLTEGTKSFSEARLAGMAAINGASDLVASAVMENATSSAAWEAFAAIGGSHSRYETGSHIDLNGTNVAAGLSKKVKDNVTLGIFVEGGNGRYTTENEFEDGDVRADGDINYFGGGVFAKIEGKKTAKGQLHGEASFRAGHTSSDYNSETFNPGTHTRFDTSNAYMGAHAGIGYKWNVTNGGNVDTYVKYLWNRQNSDSVTIDEEQFDLDAVNSHRLRAGFRYNGKENEKGIKFFGGLAYEHEFDGKATGKMGEYALLEPDFKGGSGMAELGVKYDKAGSPWKVELGLTGYTGKRDSIGARLGAWYEFGK